MPKTPNHDYNVPNAGAEDWHIPLNENFEQYDTDIEIRDEAANRSNYDPKPGAKFLATDTEAVYIGDGSDWQSFDSSGMEPNFSELSVGGTGGGIAHFTTSRDTVPLVAESDRVVSAILGIQSATQGGDAITAFSENGGRSALSAYALGSTDFGVLSFGTLGVGPQNSEPNVEIDTSGTIQFDTATSGGSRVPMMYLYPGGSNNDDQRVFAHSTEFENWGLTYEDGPDDLVFQAGGDPVMTVDLELDGTGGVEVNGDLSVSGNKNFVQSVDTDEGEKDVYYSAVEAGTPHTEVSGVAELEDGRADIDLPEHFSLVTDPDEPLMVQVTPHARERVHPQVTERSTHRVVVEEFEGETGSYEVSYTVKGTREGFADEDVVRDPR